MTNQKINNSWEEEFEKDYFTSWQMLRYKRRIPIDGNDYFLKKWNIMDDMGEWNEVTYYYYDVKKTREVSDEEYHRLKILYIEKFGGWTSINLDHTNYDGRIWW